jgi:hypothetical protein
MSQAEVARQKLLGRASKLWGNNYEHHCRHELTEVPDLVETCMQVYAAQTSTYRARLTDKRLIARYDEKTAVSLRDTVAVLRRRRNLRLARPAGTVSGSEEVPDVTPEFSP